MIITLLKTNGKSLLDVFMIVRFSGEARKLMSPGDKPTFNLPLTMPIVAGTAFWSKTRNELHK